MTRIIDTNGLPIPPNNRIEVDHHVHTFELKVRTMIPISADTIKRLLESKLEVVYIAETNETIVARIL